MCQIHSSIFRVLKCYKYGLGAIQKMHNPLRGRGGGGHQNVESHYCMAFIVKFEMLTF